MAQDFAEGYAQGKQEPVYGGNGSGNGGIEPGGQEVAQDAAEQSEKGGKDEHLG